MRNPAALIFVCLVGCGTTSLPVEDAAIAFPDGGITDEPLIFVGWDALRHWERWPYLRIGARAYMRSTYDRTGGNADSGNFLRVESPTSNVTLDVAGLGELRFFRANHWHGSPWHFRVDGDDHVLAEQSTKDAQPIANSTWLPADVEASPLALTFSTTQGADLSWVPAPFDETFTLAYERTFYGTGYYIYTLYPRDAPNLSQPIASWSPSPPPDDVAQLLERAGTDVAPNDASVTSTSSAITSIAGVTTTLADLTGPSMLRALTLTVANADAQALADAMLRITWDDRPTPSVETPVGLFFGTGSLVNRNHRATLVAALPVNVRPGASTTTFAVYLPMPFFRHAKLELVAQSSIGVTVETRTQPYADPQNWVGYLHASYVDHGTPVAGHDLVLLDTTQVEGGGDWCGHFIGTSFIFSDAGNLTTLEGDPRFFFDDSQTPQAQGTGTEEWGGGGDYWMSGQQTTLPFAGHPVGVPSGAAPISADDGIESAYRFLLGDAMPFGKNARIQLEHGGTDDSTEHYRSVAYWYARPGACLVQTDALHVSDPADEAAHRYSSPSASAVDTLTSRYEWGVDHVGATEVFPATTDTGRHTTGTSELTLAIAPDNRGVLLRRKLDYAFPDQRAEVFVADDTDGAPFIDAGTWYLAGSNSAVRIATNGELGTPMPSVIASNRRWRDDELLIPRQLTVGRSAIRVRIVVKPLDQPLEPGMPLAAQAWSEYRYTAYSYTLPP